MYLSRLLLNPMSRRVWRDLTDCCELHRTVMRAFPSSGDGESARRAFGVLYRLEVHRSSNRLVLYVQSSILPDWGFLQAGDYLAAGVEDVPNPACKRVAEQYAGITEGMVLRFRLKANPTKKTGSSTKAERLSGKPKRNGTRVPLVRPEDQIDWLKRKGEQGGFEIVNVRIASDVPDVLPRGCAVEHGYRQSKVEGRGAGLQKVVFGAVEFDGHLRVTNAELFRETLRRGIGSGKAYGFGLLSVARS